MYCNATCYSSHTHTQWDTHLLLSKPRRVMTENMRACRGVTDLSLLGVAWCLGRKVIGWKLFNVPIEFNHGIAWFQIKQVTSSKIYIRWGKIYNWNSERKGGFILTFDINWFSVSNALKHMMETHELAIIIVFMIWLHLYPWRSDERCACYPLTHYWTSQDKKKTMGENGFSEVDRTARQTTPPDRV